MHRTFFKFFKKLLKNLVKVKNFKKIINNFLKNVDKILEGSNEKYK
jgi:hypothetical protein